MRTAIIGLGVTGFSCVRYLAARDELLVLDTRQTPPNEAAARAAAPAARFVLGDATGNEDFAAIDRLIVSPGVSLEHPLVGRAVAAGVLVKSDIDLFCEAVRSPVYAVTGTNGKSTVTALSGHLLSRLGRRPGVGGNLGEAALDLLAEDHDCFVLELSSFQLERMTAQPFRAATVLNVTEDHLDRHGSLDAYACSKQRIYDRTLRAVANRADRHTLPRGEVAQLVTFGADAPVDGHWGLADDSTGARRLMRGAEPLLTVAELPLAGAHNALNVLAAFALVAEPEHGNAALANALSDFRGLPHRCQPVATRGGVSYVDDSKATNVGATLAALDGLAVAGAPRLVLIAGGDGKGADFAPLAGPVGRAVKAAVLLGRDAELLARVLTGVVPIVRVKDMDEAVAAAARLAAPGDTVLLSPACASLDMFSSYAARGSAFRKAAEALS